MPQTEKNMPNYPPMTVAHKPVRVMATRTETDHCQKLMNVWMEMMIRMMIRSLTAMQVRASQGDKTNPLNHMKCHRLGITFSVTMIGTLEEEEDVAEVEGGAVTPSL